MITKKLGKDTLGDGGKLKVGMKEYNRSTHDLSFAWRSPMGVGTLVPALKLLALPGDTYDIDMDLKVFTNPTIGPLFGDYDIQVDVFVCPIRLYIAQLHNNANGIGMNMGAIKFPQLNINKTAQGYNPTKEEKFKAVNPSSILAYLGIRGYSFCKTNKIEKELKNALPLLGYWDIVNNYYVNKQEDKYYSITYNNNWYYFKENSTYNNLGELMPGSVLFISAISENEARMGKFAIELQNGIILEGKEMIANGWTITTTVDYMLLLTFEGSTYSWTKNNQPVACYKTSDKNSRIELKAWPLETLNEIREDLLAQGKKQKVYAIASEETPKNPIEDIIQNVANQDNAGITAKSSQPQTGLAIKTYKADIFTNFINSERIKKITAGTKVDTSSGSFSIDALQLSRKKYNYLNRIAATNGTYKDWIEVSYTQDYGLRTETPIYEGGAKDKIVFEEVVNTANTESSPLGELGGRGRTAGAKKGGKLHIKIDEPSYIIGIASITPNVDYSEGNDWDDNLDNMQQLHLPEFDGIGYEDIKIRQLAYWAKDEVAYGKTTAWQNYMTNYNKVYGGFAIPNNMAHMVLNRYVDTGEYNNDQANTSSYINPEAYNYTFAVQGLDAQNFQVQIGWGIKARRKMSARQIPTM